MNTKQTEALKLALDDAIEQAEKHEPVAEVREDMKGGGYVEWLSDDFFVPGTKLYTTPPAAPVQEPVAWIVEDKYGERLEWAADADMGWGNKTEPLYTSPPASKPWVGLTEEEAAATAYKGFDDYWTEDCKGSETEAWAAAGRAIEAKLREKNA